MENEENFEQKHTIKGSVSHLGHQYKNFQQIPIQTRIQRQYNTPPPIPQGQNIGTMYCLI